MDIHPTYGYPNGLNEKPPSAHGQRTGWRLVLHWGRRAVWAVLLLLAVVALAWVASNWRDADPQSRPVELLLPAPLLVPEKNMAFALLGLHAAVDRDPARVGRELWLLDQHSAAERQALRQRRPLADAAIKAADEAHTAQRLRVSGPLLAGAAGEPWACHASQSDCVARYLAQADKLAQQRQQMAVLGARCDAALEAVADVKPASHTPPAFEELLPADLHPGAPFAGHASNANTCARWWQTGAVLAYRQGRKDESLRLLRRSQQLHLALQNGSHSLLAQMLANSLARRHFSFVSGLAAQAPDWASDLLPLLASAAPPEQLARRWVVLESALGHAVLKATSPASGRARWGDGADPTAPVADRAIALMGNWLQAHQIGWHPERSVQLLDRQRLELLQQVDAGLLAALKLQRAPASDSSRSWPWAWRNTMGRVMVELSNGHYGTYLRRHLDLELHREAATLALNAQRLKMAPAARATWARQQPTTAELQGRISWSADGATLQVRSWVEEGLSGGEQLRPDEFISIRLDRVAAP